MYLRLWFWRTSHFSSTADVHWHGEVYSTAFKLTYPGITPTYAASREVVIYRPGVYYSTVVMLCKHVSQVLSNSSLNAVTGYDDGKKGRRGKRYQNPLPIHISPLFSFDKSWVCTSLVDINYFKALALQDKQKSAQSRDNTCGHE